MTQGNTKPEIGSNISQLKKAIKDGVQRIEAEKEKRTAANEEIASIKADLVAKGIHRAALDMAMKYMSLDPDKREGFDVAYSIVREAIGLTITNQGDLFDGENGDK